ncbi:MAG TPA: hypothetical protein VKB38_09515 [Terracidiphilus sp.]|nr:hypothetical protein [Terracidiphilus sp.]
MPKIARRTVLQNLGWLSAAGAFGHSVLGCRLAKPAPAIAAPHDKNDLYLIFTGAWIMSFEGNMVRMITADFDKHTYDYVKNPVQGASTTTIDANAKYEVVVDSPPNTTSAKNLVKPMADLQQGFIFNDAVSLNFIDLPQSYQNLRSILVPMPTAIAADAIVSGMKVYADKSTIQSTAINSWPSAFALVYSGWKSVKIRKDGVDGDPTYSGSMTHYRFRVCPDGHCDPDKACPSSHTCREVDMQETHNSMAFDTLIGMLTFAAEQNGEPRYKPAISFPTCVMNQGTIDPKLTVSRGSEKDNISNFEVGMPDSAKGPICILYANLHNCAASGLIVNAVS